MKTGRKVVLSRTRAVTSGKTTFRSGLTLTTFVHFSPFAEFRRSTK